jgi:catechol 2,3-dioxygenase-like lactoylglutathione lyase family enzyme
MPDVRLTHVALSVRKLEESIAFYARYARMKVVHQRAQEGIRVAWMTDNTRPFIIVLAEMPEQRDSPLAPFGHIGIDARAAPRLTVCAIRRGPRDGSSQVRRTTAVR